MKRVAKKAAAALCLLICAVLLASLPLSACAPETSTKYYTVSYDRGNIDSTAEIAGWPRAEKVQSGDTPSRPTNPSADGWTFTDWYASAEGTARYDFNAAITADTTIYAHWTRNAASQNPDTEPVPEPGTDTEPEPAPTPDPGPDNGTGAETPGTDTGNGAGSGTGTETPGTGTGSSSNTEIPGTGTGSGAGSSTGSGSETPGTGSGTDTETPGTGADESGTDTPGNGTGTEKPYNPADIILFAGQSNMAGRGDISYYTEGSKGTEGSKEANTEGSKEGYLETYASYFRAVSGGVTISGGAAISGGITAGVAEGHGYAYNAISAPGRLSAISEPFGAEENSDVYGYISEAGAKTGSMVSAFMEAYYAQTGVPAIAVSASRGGAPAEAWTKGGAYCSVSGQSVYCDYYADTLERLESAVMYVTGPDCEYTLRNVYVVWLQGESDAELGTGAGTYISQVDSMYMSLSEDLQAATGRSLDHLYMIPIGTCEKGDDDTALRYTQIRQAQRSYCEDTDYADCISICMQDLTASGTELYLRNDTYYVHLNQYGYEILGRDAGGNMGRLVSGKEANLRRYSAEADVWYAEGDMVTVQVDIAGGMLSMGEWQSHQIAGQPLILPDNYDNLSGRTLLGWYYYISDDAGSGAPANGTYAGAYAGANAGAYTAANAGAYTYAGKNTAGANAGAYTYAGTATAGATAGAIAGAHTYAGNTAATGANARTYTYAGNASTVATADSIYAAGNVIPAGGAEMEYAGRVYHRVTAATEAEAGMVLVPYFSNDFYNLTANSASQEQGTVHDAGDKWGSANNNYKADFVLSSMLNTSDYSEDLTISWTGGLLTDGAWFRLITGYTASGNAAGLSGAGSAAGAGTGSASGAGTGSASGAGMGAVQTIPQGYYNVFHELTNHGNEDIVVTVFFCTTGAPGITYGSEENNILSAQVVRIPAGQTVQVVSGIHYSADKKAFPTAVMIGDYDMYGNRLSGDVHAYTDFELGFELGMYAASEVSFAGLNGGSISADYADVCLAATAGSGAGVSGTGAGATGSGAAGTVSYVPPYTDNAQEGSMAVYINTGESIWLPDANYVTAPEGYTFGGWYADEERTQLICSAAQTRPVYVPVSGDITFYAKWDKLATITVSLDGIQYIQGTDVTTYTAHVGDSLYDIVYLVSSTDFAKLYSLTDSSSHTIAAWYIKGGAAGAGGAGSAAEPGESTGTGAGAGAGAGEGIIVPAGDIDITEGMLLEGDIMVYPLVDEHNATIYAESNDGITVTSSTALRVTTGDRLARTIQVYLADGHITYSMDKSNGHISGWEYCLAAAGRGSAGAAGAVGTAGAAATAGAADIAGVDLITLGDGVWLPVQEDTLITEGMHIRPVAGYTATITLTYGPGVANADFRGDDSETGPLVIYVEEGTPYCMFLNEVKVTLQQHYGSWEFYIISAGTDGAGSTDGGAGAGTTAGAGSGTAGSASGETGSRYTRIDLESAEQRADADSILLYIHAEYEAYPVTYASTEGYMSTDTESGLAFTYQDTASIMMPQESIYTNESGLKLTGWYVAVDGVTDTSRLYASGEEWSGKVTGPVTVYPVLEAPRSVSGKSDRGKALTWSLSSENTTAGTLAEKDISKTSFNTTYFRMEHILTATTQAQPAAISTMTGQVGTSQLGALRLELNAQDKHMKGGTAYNEKWTISNYGDSTLQFKVYLIDKGFKYNPSDNPIQIMDSFEATLAPGESVIYAGSVRISSDSKNVYGWLQLLGNEGDRNVRLGVMLEYTRAATLTLQMPDGVRISEDWLAAFAGANAGVNTGANAGVNEGTDAGANAGTNIGAIAGANAGVGTSTVIYGTAGRYTYDESTGTYTITMDAKSTYGSVIYGSEVILPVLQNLSGTQEGMTYAWTSGGAEVQSVTLSGDMTVTLTATNTAADTATDISTGAGTAEAE